MTSSRFAEIANDLRERIALGEVGAAGALDSEAELGRRYGVSRPTVRKALELLREQGLVEPRHGAGWFVSGTAFHQRLALGTFRHAGSAVAAAGKRVERRVVEFGYQPAPAVTASALGADPGTELLRVRSYRAVDGDPLDAVVEWVRGDVSGAVSRDDATAPGIWATLARHGTPIARVRQTITAAAASEADAELLGIAPGAPVLLIRRIALGADDRALAISDHRYVAHRFALEVEFNSGPGSVADDPPGLLAVPDTHETEESEELSA